MEIKLSEKLDDVLLYILALYTDRDVRMYTNTRRFRYAFTQKCLSMHVQHRILNGGEHICLGHKP